MTNETQALLSAIETLCGKKKAKLLRRLAKAAMEAERATSQWTWPYYPWWGTMPPYTWPYSYTISDGGISSTTITGMDGTSGTSTEIYAGDPPGTVGFGTYSYTAIGPDVQTITPHYSQTRTA